MKQHLRNFKLATMLAHRAVLVKVHQWLVRVADSVAARGIKLMEKERSQAVSAMAVDAV